MTRSPGEASSLRRAAGSERAGRLSVGVPRAGFAPGSATASWPLVGRGEELAFVSALMQRRRGGVVVAGAAGVGKTRLARAILGEAEARGYATAWATATRAAASVPYGALADLLPEREGG